MSLQTLERFYTAFAALDAATMQDCYSADARFDDEAFSLQGREQIGAMWRMLCETTKQRGMAHWQLKFSDLAAEDGRGRAHWEAHYLFSATGRTVHNVIDATFEFDADGRIRRHHDRFDFWAWSRQALGLPGWLFGWSGWLRRQVRARAAAQLAKFQARA